tara:strand:+ start:620 stop:1111 length:492 start_codon:yes stop_codon:yes gene_type:complete
MIEKLTRQFIAREMLYDQYRDIGIKFIVQPKEHHTSDRYGSAQAVAENHIRAICKAYNEWGIFDTVNGDSNETYHDALLIQRDGAIECYLNALHCSNEAVYDWKRNGDYEETFNTAEDRDFFEAELSTIWNDAMKEVYDAFVIVDQCVKVCREISRLPEFIYG